MQYLCRKRQKQDMNQLDLFLGAVVLLFALGGLFGGAVRRVIQHVVLNELSKSILSGAVDRSSVITLDVEDGQLRFR